MSTNSRIGIYENNEVKSIYCHWDGYIEHNGELLYRFYTTAEDVKELIALGDLSVLGKRIGEKVDFNKMSFDQTYREKYDGQCVAYHRDRGEDFNVLTSNEETIADDQEYNYLFKNGEWYVSYYDTDYKFRPLKDYL